MRGMDDRWIPVAGGCGDESVTIVEDEASTSEGQETARWGKCLGGELSRTW